MEWKTLAQVGILIAAYIGGLLAMGLSLAGVVSKRVEELGKRIDDQNRQVNTRIGDLDSSINARIEVFYQNINFGYNRLSRDIENSNEHLAKHVQDREIHQYGKPEGK